jgi:hypothetical protein
MMLSHMQLFHMVNYVGLLTLQTIFLIIQSRTALIRMVDLLLFVALLSLLSQLPDRNESHLFVMAFIASDARIKLRRNTKP